MIRRIESFDPYRAFIDDLCRDPEFSDPMLANEEEMEVNLLRSLNRPDDRVLGVFEGETLTGLFVFLIIEEEKYIEMIVGLSRSMPAYEEILAWLQENYHGFKADFVFNPKNYLLRELLEEKGAAFDPEQVKMLLPGGKAEAAVLDADPAGIVMLSGKGAGDSAGAYREQYIALHGTEVYWTAEKVLSRPDRFNVFLAADGGRAVGYIDITNCYEENEPYDLFVDEAYRRRGWGRKLLQAAVASNRPKDMMLLVDIDNEPAIALYRSAGFVKAEGQGNLTVTWQIK